MFKTYEEAGRAYFAIWTDPNSTLNESQRDYLTLLTIRLNVREEKQADFQFDGFEGTIKKGSLVNLCSYVGRLFKAELDVQGKGRQNCSLMICDKIDPTLN